MAEINLVRGDDAIGFFNNISSASVTPSTPTLSPHAQRRQDIIDELVSRVSDLTIIVEGKVGKGEIKSEIGIGSELVKIQGEEVAVVGNFSVVDVINEQNGTTSGQIDFSITRIIGDLVQTGAIVSNNFGASAGTKIDLDNATMTFGGASQPRLLFDGTDLTIDEGIITADQLLANGSTPSGSFFGTIVGDPGANGIFGIFVQNDFESAAARFSHSDPDSFCLDVVAGGTGTATMNLASSGSTMSALQINNTAGGTTITFGFRGIIEGDCVFEDILSIEEQAAESQTVGEFSFHGFTDDDGECVFGFVMEQSVVANTTPSFTHRIPIGINNVEYWAYFELRT